MASKLSIALRKQESELSLEGRLAGIESRLAVLEKAEGTNPSAVSDQPTAAPSATPRKPRKGGD